LNVEIFTDEQLLATLRVDEQALRQNMKKRRSTLRHLIEPNSGFLDCLFHKEVLTEYQIYEIAASLYNKNDKLLDFLLNRYADDCSKVTEALVATGQLHVAHFISSPDGKF
jgi:hypothetical protein